MIDAELARSALAAYEIAAAIQQGPHHQLAKTFDLVVREDDAEAADEILGPDEKFSN
jgi:hypothetical protein